MKKPLVYFSDYFNVDSKILDECEAFNISLISDLPLFIDPFLLFTSKNSKYQYYHERIIDYLTYLKNVSIGNFNISTSFLRYHYTFPEIKQTWLGFSQSGNKGLGLGLDFAKKLHSNLHNIFKNFGDEKITNGTHLEKLCLIENGVGKDKISDFTTNLVLELLLNFTQEFTKKYIVKKLQKKFLIKGVRFNYNTETFEYDDFILPAFNNNYVILTPKNILTREDTWINKNDLLKDFDYYTRPVSMQNDVLRENVNRYFRSILPRRSTDKDRREAAKKTIQLYPELIDYFINYKENNGEKAEGISSQEVLQAKNLYIENFEKIIELLNRFTPFYQMKEFDSYEASLERCKYLKDIIENKGGWKIFYIDGSPIKREDDLKILYRLTWYGTIFDVSTEVNDGRGPADNKISLGALNKNIVEFKLASNTQLKRNLQYQAEIYQKSSDSKTAIKVILFFNYQEELKLIKILNELGIANKETIIKIDARKDNKPSASKAISDKAK